MLSVERVIMLVKTCSHSYYIKEALKKHIDKYHVLGKAVENTVTTAENHSCVKSIKNVMKTWCIYVYN